MTTKLHRVRLAMAAVTLMSSAAGCGGLQRGDVSGIISMNGKPVVSGTVTFIGADGNTKTATITESGAYKVQGVVTGTATIVIDSPKPNVTPTSPSGRSDGRGRDSGRGVDPNLPADAPRVERPRDNPNAVSDEVAKKWFPIPPQYSDNTKTTLKFDVLPGTNRHDVILK